MFISIVYLMIIMTVPMMIARAYGKPGNVHDHVLQVEAAADFLMEGKNPYKENYFSTELNQWGKISTTQGVSVNNYALLHCVKLPWDFISAIPLKLLFEHTIHFYDHRMLYLPLYILTLFLVYAIPQAQMDKNLFLVLYGLNPIFVAATAFGVGDIFVVVWVLCFVYLLKIEKIRWAGFFLGLACVSKHSAWFLVPFYLMFLWFRCRDKKGVFAQGWPLAVAPLVMLTPFILWDPAAFWEDIYQYPAGTIPTSYHINGYGFSMLLYTRGVLKSIYSPYPAWLFQLPLGGLLFIFLYKWQKRRNTVSQLMLNSALFLFVFWFFSRFFHENYVGYLSIIFLTAYFTYEEQELSHLSVAGN